MIGRADLALHLVTNDRIPFARLLGIVDAAIDGGVTLVQLRDKQVSTPQLLTRAVDICRDDRRAGMVSSSMTGSTLPSALVTPAPTLTGYTSARATWPLRRPVGSWDPEPLLAGRRTPPGISLRPR